MDTQLSSRSHPVIGPPALPLAPVPLFLTSIDDFQLSGHYFQNNISNLLADLVTAVKRRPFIVTAWGFSHIKY